MRCNGPHVSLILVGLSLCLENPLIAEPPSPPPAAPAAPSPLSGPKAQPATPAKPSLVRLGFNGELIRLDEHPAQGAVRLMKLEGEPAANVEKVIVERTATLDKMVADNIEFLLELGTVGALAKDGSAKDKADVAGLLLRGLKKISEINRKGTLEVRVRRALPVDRRAEFDRYIKEYFDAVAADGVVDDGMVTKKGSHFECAIAENVRLLGKEIERSFQRLVGDGEKDFEKILAALDLRPEQEQKIRSMVEAFAGETKFKPTQTQQTLLFLRIIDVLDPPQRKAFAKFVRESEGQTKPSAPKPSQPAPMKPE